MGTRTRDRAAVVDRLLDEYGTTYAAEAGFTVRDAPAALFRLSCLATLLSARIRAEMVAALIRVGLADAYDELSA